jgi:hypothetical protein
MKWKCENGEQVQLDEMSTEHIVHAIQWLKDDDQYGNNNKDGYTDTLWVAAFSQVLRERGY